jgi:hypothetical protein
MPSECRREVAMARESEIGGETAQARLSMAEAFDCELHSLLEQKLVR